MLNAERVSSCNAVNDREKSEGSSCALCIMMRDALDFTVKGKAIHRHQPMFLYYKGRG